MKLIVAATVLSLCTGAALAQEDLRIDRDALYVTDPAACSALEDKGLDAWTDLDFRALTFREGIQSMAVECDFFDVKERDGSNFLFVDAICELPGDLYPDTLAITPLSESEIHVVSSYDAAMIAAGLYQSTNEGTSPGATVFHRCDSLSEIPVD